MRPAEPYNLGKRSIPVENRPTRRLLRLGLFVVAFLVIAYFIGRSIWSEWDVIRGQPWRLHPGWLLCSAAVVWLDFLIMIQLWRVLLCTVSQKRLRFGTAFRITVLSNLGKYVPGKVWTFLGMVFLLRREGYTLPEALASTVLHQAFTLITGAVFVAVVLGPRIISGVAVIPLILGCVLSVVVLYPPLFSRLLNWGLRLLKREPLTIKLSFAKSVALFAAYFVAWIVYGTSFWCLLRGIGIHPGTFADTVAAFGAAYLIGFLAMFAPGGLGVREGALTVLLAPQLQPGLAAFVAVVARLWMTMMELTELIPIVGGWGRSKTVEPKATAPTPQKPH